MTAGGVGARSLEPPQRNGVQRRPQATWQYRGIDKVILVDNLGNAPGAKYTQGGMAITRIRLATTSVRWHKDGNP